MPDYKLAKIYKLVSNKSPDIYIGSCVTRLSTRLSHHKCKTNKCSSKKLFLEDAIVTIVLLEDYPCDNKNMLKARELHHITSNVCININKPFVSEIQYGTNEYIKEYNKEYRLDNADHIKERQKIYDLANVEHKKQYRLDNSDRIKERQKIYNLANSDRIKEQKKQYDQSRRDQRNSKQRSRYAERKLLASLETLSI